jgi:hypothetical protein
MSLGYVVEYEHGKAGHTYACMEHMRIYGYLKRCKEIIKL